MSIKVTGTEVAGRIKVLESGESSGPAPFEEISVFDLNSDGPGTYSPDGRQVSALPASGISKPTPTISSSNANEVRVTWTNSGGFATGTFLNNVATGNRIIGFYTGTITVLVYDAEGIGFVQVPGLRGAVYSLRLDFLTSDWEFIVDDILINSGTLPFLVTGVFANVFEGSGSNSSSTTLLSIS